MADVQETQGKSPSLKPLIEKFAAGKATADEVAKAVRKFNPSALDNPTYEQREKQAMEDDFGDYRGSFSEVVAAWISGTINDAQYGELRAAFSPGDGDGQDAENPTENVAEAPAPAAPPAAPPVPGKAPPTK